MKKYFLSMLVVVGLVFILGNAQVSAQHFDYDEAWEILNGKWVDTDTGAVVYPVWKSKDGSECNIVPNTGYTNPRGESKIFFDYKGVRANMRVTYYPGQDKYYGVMIIYDQKLQSYKVIHECLAKE
ncbi:MAG: hypothetical protein PHQ46_02160 [Negativicutes bacterium]|nr:hypothetical protein [Negativicutes bacterium]